MAAKIGSGGLLVLNNNAPEEMRIILAKLGAIEVEIADKTEIGVCQVVLPIGVSFPGHSRLLTHKHWKGRHFMDIPESFIASP
jgi:hypothetical protein